MFDYANFRFNKRYGQNFLSDRNLLSAIATDAGVTAEDTVLEIGAGAGALTEVLAERAKRVVAYEIDERLADVLAERFRDKPNVEIVIADFMKASDAEIREKAGEKFKVIANIPYYITTPIVMRFVEGKGAESVTVTVQKEVGLRFTANPGTADYGAVTAAIALRGEAKLTRNISRKLFYPVPDVDSCVVNVVLSDKYPEETVKAAMKFVKCGFMMRRKTLVNNMKAAFGMDKERAAALLQKIGFAENVRGETLSPDDYVRLAQVCAESDVY
ncbi:MAG: 16S rRNA (adenine(1518)-N(6)/adenine(1519)-N(6))-dimethyltransferase RsmA [Christensenellales bacterium]